MRIGGNILAIIIAFFSSLLCSAEYTVDITAGLTATYGSNEFTPFYLASNRYGTLTQSKGLLFNFAASDSLDKSKRFDFAWTAEFWCGVSSQAMYDTWIPSLNSLRSDNPQRPAPIWLQQLYAEVKYRCLYLGIGMKDRGSALLDQSLSSGDVVWSGNSRSIPEVRIGFVDFQNIPFTNGWVQADVVLSYGKFADKNWIRNHNSKWRGNTNMNNLWTYKRIYLRTKPVKPFSFLFGFQMSGFFGGTTYRYANGIVKSATHNPQGIVDFLKMILPIAGDSEGEYVAGDHKGSWDGEARYRLRNGDNIRAYFQWFWEDGSGVVKNNGWDGLWGIEYKSSKRGWINGAVVEYLDFTHQSGPLHFDPNDNPGTTITTQVRGRDNYYNSWYYRAYTNYGMTIGTPMVMGTIYNTDGEQTIAASRVRGIHFAVSGSINRHIDYILKYNHRKAWGETNSFALVTPLKADSWMVGMNYQVPCAKGLNIGLELGLDKGNLPSNGASALLSITYSRPITFKRNDKKNLE